MPPFPVQQGGGSGGSYVYKAAKLLLQSGDGSFAWEDTRVRLDQDVMPDASHVTSTSKIPWQNLEEPGQAELLKEIYRVYFCPVHLP